MLRFFNLPLTMCIDILVNWCDISQLNDIDSAVCNKSNRDKLRLMYHYPQFVLKEIILNLYGFVNWMATRKLKFKTLIMQGELKYNFASTFKKLDFSRMKLISFIFT